jgi:ferric-dicitrate binding protein FerR (iron transport regulator)
MDNAIHSRYCIAPLLHHRCDPCLAAAVLALVGGGWLGWSHWRSQPLFSEHYATVRGQALQVRLPDGSQMLLDAASQAQVQLFRGRREVRLLEGQALFHASADAQRPFEVRAGHTLVTVLGTRFSVRHTRAVRDPAVAAMRVGGSFELREATSFAQALPLLLPVRLKTEGGVTEIVKAR